MGTQEPGYPSAAWQPTPPRRWRTPAIVAGTAAVALLAGVAIGAVLNGDGNDSGAFEAGSVVGEPDSPDSAPAAAEVHAQDVGLCTSYTIINSAIPRPDQTGADLLPVVTALQNALDGNPHASASIRGAVADMASVYQARIGAYGKVRTRGLAEPPVYTVEAERAASDQVWSVCRLDEE